MSEIQTPAGYNADAERLADRIAALIPAHPEILAFTSPWQLFKVQGFKSGDISLSLAQASWALEEAKRRQQP